jgi:hypothetical protein
MLNMPTMGENHVEQRKWLASGHEKRMNKLLEKNSHKSKYWILGTVRSKRKDGKTRIMPFLEAFDVQPSLTKEAYLYEVDNTAGTRTLLWVMHPNEKLTMPSIGKSISVSGGSRE